MRVSRRGFIQAVSLLGIASAAIPSTVVAQATSGSVELPTSRNKMTGSWQVMNPTTFQLTHKAVLEQYDRVAAVNSKLTVEKRSRLESMLATGKGVEVWVPDGIGLDYLTGRKVGKPHVYLTMKKQLGRVDRAILFDLGDGVAIYWFTGTKQSCNNIGVVINEPIAGLMLQPPLKVAEYTWVLMPQDDLEVFRAQGYIPSIYIAGCCNNTTGVCSGRFISGILLEPGQVDEEPTLVRVRVPKPN